MIRLFQEITDPERNRPLRRAIAYLAANRFPWNTTYLATATQDRNTLANSSVVSTRKYGQAVREFTEAYGLEKSEVSEHFIEASRRKLKEMIGIT